MPLLQLDNVTRSFGSTRALCGVQLSIARGEIVALMGANGAGKSTLVKIVSGVIAPDEGAVHFKGAAYAPRSPAEAARAGIVTVHQSTDIVGAAGLTVAEVLLLNRFAARQVPFFISPGRIRREAKTILSAAGFALPLDRDFGDLAAADRQLVAIARALADKADLLILDEPTAGLSGEESRRLFEVLQNLRGRGLAILYISHRIGDLAAIADRAIVMRSGRVVASYARPIDFPAAMEMMIGRRLNEVPSGLSMPRNGSKVMEIRKGRLLPTSEIFDLDLHEGEVVAVTGVLGSGKSRLLSAIFGAGRLAQGEIFLDGAPYLAASPAEAIARGVAMAGEDRHRSSLMPANWQGDSVAATISLPNLSKWFPRGLLLGGREQQQARKAIDRLGIRAAGPSASVWTLSGGNQQKTVIARWEAEPGRLLLLDEPFQGVDVGARHDIVKAIREAKSRATLIATSDPEEAFQVADRIMVMERHGLRAVADNRAEPSTPEKVSA